MALSLLLHLLALFLLHYLLKQPQKVAQYNTLQVQLVRSSPAPQKIPHKIILTTNKHAPIKVTAPPTPQAVPAPVVTTAPQTEAVTGIAMPGAIASPLNAFNVQGNAFFREQHPQQDAMRAYQEHIVTVQARQQAEQQAQLIIQQLHQLLAKQLHVEPRVTGICKLIEYDTGRSQTLSCEPSTLYDLLHKDQYSITAMLLTLRGMGQGFSGFSVERNVDKLQIKLLPDDSRTNR
jgi:hypothetical protein